MDAEHAEKHGCKDVKVALRSENNHEGRRGRGTEQMTALWAGWGTI
ncbi:MAG: hypothetical protein WC740_07045 [Verrucomicrobiia bacterium]